MKNQARLKTAALAICFVVGLPVLAQEATKVFGDTGAEKRSPTFFKAIKEIAAEQDKVPSKEARG